ncbi:4-toluene sulfonate uptake permease [Plasmopara halstedii]|uniref:4-toluene sulfonate uptake permease n=1 Tax=Plasmopara halstedii TaxID=4781 RepID=A0A0P1AQW9_PLAHL|nr:4-toluene sulfonate uptake permease [Plasmopara halstedii]CEG43990.1 4-toluene sulfonate uptake permease [Plasmopara halstedii]|eukprot:XP_024580359.1 4-toluene sulfonate uptake permease [Plasmopara halstedii]
MLATSLRRYSAYTRLQGRRVLCSTAKERSARTAIPLGVGVISGGVAGVVSALTGVGGGIILIPAMVKFTSLTQQAINGTSLGSVAIAASVGAWNYFEAKTCNVPLALATTIPAIIATKYGVRTAHRLTSKALSFVVGSAMLLCSPLIFLKNSQYMPKWSDSQDPLDLQFFVPQQKDLIRAYKSSSDGDELASITAKSAEISAEYVERVKANYIEFVIINAKYVVAGAAAGFVSGLCGLGGGILITSYLTAASDMPQATIIGTSLLSVVPTAASSTIFNLRAKSVHLPTAVRIGGSMAAGAYVTSKYITQGVHEDVLRGILGVTLSTAALVMMRRAY